MKEKYLYNYSFDEFVKTIKHYCNLLYLSKNLIVFKYMISILTILLLHTNNLYAQAKRTDTVSILRSASFDKECLKKCENDPIELDVKEVGFIEWYVSGRKYYENGKDRCSYMNYKVNNKRGILNDKSLNISGGCNTYYYCDPISVVLDPRYSKVFMIASFRIREKDCYYTEKSWAYDVKCVLGGFYESVLFSLSGSKSEWDKEGDYYLGGRLDINTIIHVIESKSVPEQLKTQKDKICTKTRNLCKASCSRYNMYIGNKEIKTVGDLLDSIPATELLKVYDPNIIYEYDDGI